MLILFPLIYTELDEMLHQNESGSDNMTLPRALEQLISVLGKGGMFHECVGYKQNKRVICNSD